MMRCVIVMEKELSAIRQMSAALISIGELMHSTFVSMSGKEIDILNLAYNMTEGKLISLTEKYPTTVELSDELVYELDTLCQNNAFLKGTIGSGVVNPNQFSQILRELNPRSNISKILVPVIKAAKSRNCGLVII